jgi:prevent-host-death family protein
MRIAKSDARKRFSEVVTRAANEGERVKITHYGKTLAILISKGDLERLVKCEETGQRGAARSRRTKRSESAQTSRRRK